LTSGSREREQVVRNFAYVCLVLAAVGLCFSVMLGQTKDSMYYWGIPASAFFIFGYYVLFQQSLHLKKLRELREGWGKEIRKKRDFSLIRMYFDYEIGKGQFYIDDRTWEDLNMDQVFCKLDRTLSSAGQHVLYDILRKPLFNENDLKKRGQIIARFQDNNNTQLREDLQVLLSRLDKPDEENALYLLWEEIKAIKRGFLYNVLCGLAVVSPLTLLISIPAGIISIFLMFFINMYAHYSVQKAIQGHFPSIRYVGRLIKCALDILKLEDETLKDSQIRLTQAVKPVSDLPRKVGLVGARTLDELYQYISIFFLIEVRTFWKVMRIISRYRKEFQEVYKEVGMLDALLAVASYRESLSFFCKPDFFVNGHKLKIENAYHPLLDDPVPNSISVSKNGNLVTGSNMSGKSTFLRVIGINVLFAQTIYTCLASSYQGLFYKLISSIGRSDNVVEGKSYYLVEALALLRIIQSVNDDVPTLCIVDEIFRGTNSIERIAAAQCVLEYLARKNCLTFAATHDLELTELLKDSYLNLHFSERVTGSGLEFDYRLKEGPSTTKNAIKLLKFLGYPEDIIEHAEIQVKEFAAGSVSEPGSAESTDADVQKFYK
jgi:hypothetical protein